MEKLIYDLVKDRPWLKEILKKLYQGVFSLTGRRQEYVPSDMVIRPNCFFGFHDKSPWSPDNSMLLAHRYSGKGNETESASNPIEIIIFTGADWTTARKVAKTRAWNWQQGSQLQWKGNNIIFNDFLEGQCRAVEIDVSGNRVKVHPYAVGAVSQTDEAMACFCFKHFGDVMAGYGYDFDGAGANANIDPDTLVIVDGARGDEISIKGNTLPPVVFDETLDGIPFISHALFSPSGSKLAFMRRVAVPGRRRRSALFIYDRGSGTTIRVPFKNMVSHFCWLNDGEIFAYANTQAGDGYYLYQLEDDALQSYASTLKSVDGHPHADASGKNVVFDTYPDKQRLQRLAILDLNKDAVHELARLYSPMKFWGTKRVDLHPRIRSDGKFACIDCSTIGKRSLATLPVHD